MNKKGVRAQEYANLIKITLRAIPRFFIICKLAKGALHSIVNEILTVLTPGYTVSDWSTSIDHIFKESNVRQVSELPISKPI